MNQPFQDTDVVIVYPQHPPAFGRVRIRHYPKNERLRRALKTWIGSWLLALFAVFIPLLHFFLVPLLVFGGAMAAYFAYNQQSVILGGTGSCPACQAPLSIEKTSLKWPLEETCTQCWRKSSIQAAA